MSNHHVPMFQDKDDQPFFFMNPLINLQSHKVNPKFKTELNMQFQLKE